MSYCSQSDVETWLRPYVPDLIDADAYGSSQAVQARIRELLPTTKRAIDWLADRDFEYHADATITLDGDGYSDTLFLCDLGVKPIERVERVVENGKVLDGYSYAVYGPEGLLRRCQQIMGAGLATPGRRWAEGVRNITVTLTYGYSDIRNQLPAIVLAQAQLTAAAVLGHAGAVGANGVESKRLGTFAVTYPADSPFASTVVTWIAGVRETVSRFRRTGVEV